MELQIRNSTPQDIDSIFKFYKFATDFQKAKSVVSWPEFDRKLIEQELKEEDGCRSGYCLCLGDHIR